MRQLTEVFSAIMGDLCRRAPGLLLVRGSGASAVKAAEHAAAQREGVAVASVCSYAVDGPFSGISRLMQELVRTAERHELQSLVAAHDASLTVVAPALSARYPPRYPMLTLTAPRDEAVRVFGVEWPTRYVNGAIDFLFELQDQLGGRCMVIGLVDVHEAGALLEEFVSLLARRAGSRPIVLWVSTTADSPAVKRAAVHLPMVEVTAPVDGAPAEAVLPAGDMEADMGHLIQEHLAAGRRSEAIALLADATRQCAQRGMVADTLRLARQWESLVGPGAPPSELVPMLNRLAGALQGVGDYHGVEALIRQALALELQPRMRASCLYTLAMLYTRYYPDKDLPRALGYVEEALAGLGPDATPDAVGFYQNGLALVLLRMGRIAEAGEICLQAIRLLEAQTEPHQFRLQKAVLMHNIARVMVQLQRYDEALHYFEATMELDPFYSELYQERGTLMARLGQPEAALADYLRGVEYGPPSHQLAACLGNAAMGAGRPEQGTVHFSRALELDDAFAYAFKGRAMCQYDLGLNSEALADYDAYLRLRPNDAEALSNRGSLRHDAGDIAGALADLTRALELAPDSVAALANRAAVLADAGRHTDALGDLEKAILLEPSNETLRQNRRLLVSQ